MVSFTKAFSYYRLQIPRKPYLLFAAVWIVGMALGTSLSAAASNSFSSVMRMAPQSPVSVVGLAVTVLLPFLLSAFAVYKDKPQALYVVCFIKIFHLMFSGFSIWSAFGSAGWLVRFLLQFSDICTTPILCWFSLNNIDGRKIRWQRDLLISAGIYMCVCCLDLLFISPFLALITENL